MSALSGIEAAAVFGQLGGADYGEAFFESSEGLSLSVEDSRVEDIAETSDQGLGLRFLTRAGGGIVTDQGSSQSLSSEIVAQLKAGLFKGRALSQKKSGAALSPRSFGRHPVRLNPFEVPLDDKIALLKSIDSVVRSEFPFIRQVTLSYSQRRRETALINSEGDNCLEERVSVVFSASVICEKNGVLQTGREVLGALMGYELLKDQDPLAMARMAARRAVAKLDCPKANAGEMPLILSSEAGGTFIHEAIGHSLEVDHVQEGSSPAYKGKIGSVIAPETITVIDDPTLPFYRGSFKFDDDGTSARPTVLVKNGVLTDYLYDRVTAMKENKPSNGHGRRESFHCRPIPRMSNLYIAPGPDDPRLILKELKRGVLVTRMGGGQVNTATGEFVFEVDEGFWVEDGVIRHMIRDANLLGVGPEVLRSIGKVGWDIGWGIGTCGKDGQGVPVSDGQPTLSIPKILIGGKAS
jgi:TldD protein